MKKFLKGGKFDKFLVLKSDDIQRHLSDPDKMKLTELAEKVCDGRHKEGKPWSNTYLVINTDESYAPEIVEVLKRNGHWG